MLDKIRFLEFGQGRFMLAYVFIIQRLHVEKIGVRYPWRLPSVANIGNNFRSARLRWQFRKDVLKIGFHTSNRHTHIICWAYQHSSLFPEEGKAHWKLKYKHMGKVTRTWVLQSNPLDCLNMISCTRNIAWRMHFWTYSCHEQKSLNVAIGSELRGQPCWYWLSAS
jgi:hypothetical protein